MNLVEFDDARVKLIKDTICKGASTDELELFLHVCRQTGLDPMLRQIYSIPRKDKFGKINRTIQTSIDGLRLIADRTGKYAPGSETQYVYGKDGQLIAATAYVKKMTPDGTWHEVSAVAFMDEYNPGYGLWGKLPHVMIAKCAEAQALRRAFPAEMCGLYSMEEITEEYEEKTIKVESTEKLPIKEKLVDIPQVLTKEQHDQLVGSCKTAEQKAWLASQVAALGVESTKDIPQDALLNLRKSFPKGGKP